MSEPSGKSEWLSPGAIIGIVGMLAAATATYSSFSGRISVSEAQAQQTDKRLERLESKVDFIIGHMASERAEK